MGKYVPQHILLETSVGPVTLLFTMADLADAWLTVPPDQALRAARLIPRDFVRVDAIFHRISHKPCAFNKGVDNMDFDTNIRAYQGEHAETTDVKDIYVAPFTEELPSDGVLEYTAVTSVYDVKQAEAYDVLCIRPNDYAAFKLVAENPDVFGVRVTVLHGVPGALYTPDFDAVFWSNNRAAYATLVNDLRTAQVASARLKQELAGREGRERARITASDGSVKDYVDFDVAGEENE